MECNPLLGPMLTAVSITRPGGAIGRVGMPHYQAIPASRWHFLTTLQ